MNNSLALLAFLPILFFSCEKKEKIEQEVSIITGSTNRTVSEDIVLPPPSFLPDIESLRMSGNTNSIKMVAFGGSFFAGYRDGGLYREGQLTSIPTLIAHQMQLESFMTPLFSKESGNGTGYLVYDRASSLPSWKKVENNLGVVSQNPFSLEKYIGEDIHNISWPFGPGSSSDSSNAVYHFPEKKEYYSYLYRFYNNRGASERPFEILTDSKEVDLVLNMDDLDSWIGMASYSKKLLKTIDGMLHEGYFSPKREFIIDNLSKDRKLVLFNFPNFLDFPYFHLYGVENLKLKGTVSGSLEDVALLIPTDDVKRMFMEKNTVPFSIEDSDFLTQTEVNSIKIVIQEPLNKNVYGAFATQYNLPLVDLFSLYNKILSKQYYSDDGVFIDPSFPDGNFFSEDGIHPTIIGNAVIANETIKVINENYKTKIPLINISQLVNI